MSATIMPFPVGKPRYGLRLPEPASVIILPVVRIESHPPGPRQSRRRVLEKVRQLQEEMLRSPRS